MDRDRKYQLVVEAKKEATKLLVRTDERVLKAAGIDLSAEECQALDEANCNMVERHAGVMGVSSLFHTADKAHPLYKFNAIRIGYNPHCIVDDSQQQKDDLQSIMLHEMYHAAKNYRAVKYHYEFLRLGKGMLYTISSPRVKAARVAVTAFWPMMVQHTVDQVGFAMNQDPVQLPYLATLLGSVALMRYATRGLRSEERKANRVSTILGEGSGEQATMRAVKNKGDQNWYQKMDTFFSTSKNPVVKAVNNMAAFMVNFTHPLPYLRGQQEKADLAVKESLAPLLQETRNDPGNNAGKTLQPH